LGRRLKIIIGVFALAAIISYFLIDANEKQFDKTQWHASPLTRYKMSKDIVESNMLIGKTKEDVISILGKASPFTLEGKEHLIYYLGKTPTFFEAKEETLVIVFDELLATKVVQSYE